MSSEAQRIAAFEEGMKGWLRDQPDSSVKELWNRLLNNTTMARRLQSCSQNDIRDGILRAAMEDRQQILDKIRGEGDERLASIAEDYVSRLA